ncbi:MAG: VCBS repeat-containing protein [Oceanospirillaceae bacterium]|nr:VCBS repeat-containing protein [Oceanospirillaceae bacterium]
MKNASVIAAALLTGCQTTVPSSNSPITNPVSIYETVAQLNQTTSRHKRTGYECRMAIEPMLKPGPLGLDNFRMDKANLGHADLYGDGTIETVAGFSDEMYAAEGERHVGNQERSREYSQYMFFSPDNDFRIPDNSEFMMARNIIPSDFNGDGIDDLLFVQHGPDYKPYVPQPNFILMSSDTGYKRIKLPGRKATHHGGAAGDIDRDGDIDIVVTPSDKNIIVAYINDGTGSFTATDVIGKGRSWHQNDRNYNAQLWDIDQDGFLDLIVDGHEETTAVYWGQRNEGGWSGNYFETKPSRINSLENQLFQDMEFADIDGDGRSELIFLSSLKLPESNHFYQGWGVYSVQVNGRRFGDLTTVYEKKVPNKFIWYPYITACDLKNDGDYDLVVEAYGQPYNPEDEKIDKFVLENQGKGSFKFHRLTSPIYLAGPLHAASKQAAKEIGVSVERYEPAQIYYPSDNGKRYLSWEPWPNN